MIEIQHVTKQFGDRVILDNISIDIQNQLIGILGPSGCGKTTFLKCMMGNRQMKKDIRQFWNDNRQ